MNRTSAPFHLLLPAGAALALASCANLMPPSYQPTPESIRPGSSAENVQSILGKPDWAEPYVVVNSQTGTQSTGSIWHYTDQWWKRTGWGSWDVYFDSNRRYIGWRMTSPASAEPNSREVFFARVPQGAPSARADATAPAGSK